MALPNMLKLLPTLCTFICLKFKILLLFKVWFQNQRAKMKKMKKKAGNENKTNAELENEEKVNIKEEEQSEYT